MILLASSEFYNLLYSTVWTAKCCSFCLHNSLLTIHLAGIIRQIH